MGQWCNQKVIKNMLRQITMKTQSYKIYEMQQTQIWGKFISIQTFLKKKEKQQEKSQIKSLT